MHSHQDAGRRPPHRQADVPTIDTYENLGQVQVKQEQQAKAEQRLPKRPNAASVYRAFPNDLDRIAFVNSEVEVLDLLNQVLQVLHRSGMMAEVPEPLRMPSLTTPREFRIAIKKFRSGITFTENVDWNSDALFVLRTIFAAAEEKLRMLRRRK